MLHWDKNTKIDTAKISESHYREADSLWCESKHEAWAPAKLSGHGKGHTGAAIVIAGLEANGYEARKVNDQGDVEFRKPWGTWQRAEVKAARGTFEVLKRPKGFITEHFWFNQVRPLQKGWRHLFLVGMYPNHTKVWYKSREEWDKEYKTLSSVNCVLSHVGQGEQLVLEAVGLKKNSISSNFDEWREIYNDQDGELF